jgi:phosphoribosyl-dephospho-CoA transferase
LVSPQGTTTDTLVIVRDTDDIIRGTTPLVSFSHQIPGGIKETDAMTRSLLSVTSILDGHHKKNKIESNLQKQISVIYDMESRARVCGDIERAKLLKKRPETIEEMLLKE